MERCRASDLVPYVKEELTEAQERAEIYENENKIGQRRKPKPSTANDIFINQGFLCE